MRKIVIITGVGKGFGRELLFGLCNEYHIIGITRSQDDIEWLNIALAERHCSADLIKADITEHESLLYLLDAKLDEVDGRVYGLINNAGVRCRRPFGELGLKDFIAVAEVNLFAAIWLSSVIIPRLEVNGEGRIINISSILSQSALPELSAYAVSKGGLDAFTRSLAVEFGGQNIAVNSILPGFCKTSYYSSFIKNDSLLEMTLSNTPMKRWGEDSEIVGLAKFLLSKEAAYITGASIPIDGGWLA